MEIEIYKALENLSNKLVKLDLIEIRSMNTKKLNESRDSNLIHAHVFADLPSIYIELNSAQVHILS